MPGAAPAEVQKVIASEAKTQVAKAINFLELVDCAFWVSSAWV